MRTVILAAGSGSRMLPLSMYMEKSMLYVGGKPVVRRIVENVRNAFPKQELELVVLDKYRKDFEHEFRDISPVYFTIVSVPEPKGTVSAYLESHTAKTVADDSAVMIHYADTVTDLNYYNLHLAYHASDEAVDCILAVSKNIRHEYSQVDFNAHNKVQDFYEKPTLPAYSWTGIAIFDRQSMAEVIGTFALEDIGTLGVPNVPNDFGTQVFPRMLEKKMNVIAYPYDGRYDDVGNILSYWRLQREHEKETSVQT